MKSVVLAAAAAWLLVAAELVAADAIIYGEETEEEAKKYTLPEGFLFGAGTSSYQVEGAWNVSGKGINVFDKSYNIDGKNPDPLHNGNIAADSYHRIAEDIEMIRQLKLQIYRFSISWARLLPDGDASNPNPDGVRYYKELIKKLREINVEPLITLYHFDHPQTLHDQYDSWLGRGMIDKFVEYADFAFEQFGDQVTYWTTMNEPNMYCRLVYSQSSFGAGLMAPGNGSEGVGAYYTCIHYQLIAHAKTYKLYQEKYASKQKGKIGLTCLATGGRANSTSEADIKAAERTNTLGTGLCAAPLIFGDYPEIVITEIDKESEEAGLATSKLPKFTDEEKEILKNSIDFLGLNVYFGRTVSYSSNSEAAPGGGGAPAPGGGPDGGQSDGGPGSNPTGEGGSPGGGGFPSQAWQPWAMEASLVYVVDYLNNIPVIVTESGCEDSNGIRDQERAAYHSAYMRSMLKAINERGAKVLAMTVWALIDDFEWSRAYGPKMGMVHIDFTSPERTRTLKDSSDFFVKMMTTRRVPLVEKSSTQPITPTSHPANGSSSAAWNCHSIILTYFLLIKLLF